MVGIGLMTVAGFVGLLGMIAATIYWYGDEPENATHVRALKMGWAAWVIVFGPFVIRWWTEALLT